MNTIKSLIVESLIDDSIDVSKDIAAFGSEAVLRAMMYNEALSPDGESVLDQVREDAAMFDVYLAAALDDPDVLEDLMHEYADLANLTYKDLGGELVCSDAQGHIVLSFDLSQSPPVGRFSLSPDMMAEFEPNEDPGFGGGPTRVTVRPTTYPDQDDTDRDVTPTDVFDAVVSGDPMLHEPNYGPQARYSDD
jgi:hypothetical protein